MLSPAGLTRSAVRSIEYQRDSHSRRAISSRGRARIVRCRDCGTQADGSEAPATPRGRGRARDAAACAGSASGVRAPRRRANSEPPPLGMHRVPDPHGTPGLPRIRGRDDTAERRPRRVSSRRMLGNYAPRGLAAASRRMQTRQGSPNSGPPASPIEAPQAAAEPENL